MCASGEVVEGQQLLAVAGQAGSRPLSGYKYSSTRSMFDPVASEGELVFAARVKLDAIQITNVRKALAIAFDQLDSTIGSR